MYYTNVHLVVKRYKQSGVRQKQITVDILASDLVNVGYLPITVRHPANQSGSSRSLTILDDDS